MLYFQCGFSRGSCSPESKAGSGLECLAQLFPFHHPPLQLGSRGAQFLRNPLCFLGADEALQGGFTLGDGIFQAVDLTLKFVHTIFYLFAFDGVQAPGAMVLGFRRWPTGMAIRRLRIGW